MSRKSNEFKSVRKSFKDESDSTNGGFNLTNLLNNETVQNLMKNEKTMNTFMSFASQMTPHLINADMLNQILDANPNITDELITEQINQFKKTHPDSIEVIDKYLQPYKEKRLDENVYNIRKFVKSDDCKKALDNPQVKQYLKEVFKSPEIKDKFSSLIKKK